MSCSDYVGYCYLYAEMWLHLVMDYQGKALASPIFIWQHWIQLQEMRRKMRDHRLLLASFQLDLAAWEILRTLLVQNSLLLERYAFHDGNS